MPILDDEQFERYLKEFRPVAAPELMQIKKPASVLRRPFVLTAWAAASAALLVVAFLLLPHHFKSAQPSAGSGGPVVAPQQSNPQPLTLGRANALLVRAPSLKEAFDDLSFQPQPAAQPEGKQSALAALGKENIKL